MNATYLLVFDLELDDAKASLLYRINEQMCIKINEFSFLFLFTDLARSVVDAIIIGDDWSSKRVIFSGFRFGVIL